MTDAKPSGFLSVMADRRETDPEALDYFPTPPWAARAGGELLSWLDPMVAAREATCWEPACGEGHMAWGLADYFASPLATTDIHDYGFGGVLDFLGEAASGWKGRYDWIVTNPPFVCGEAFVRAGLARARRGVAMLVRLSFIESVGRYELLQGAHPVRVVAPFAERVPMVKGRWDPKASTATAYAWCVWAQPGVDLTAGEGMSVFRLIAPGARERLHRAADVARFCAPEAGDLLKAMEGGDADPTRE